MIDAIVNESALDEHLMAPSERDVAAASQLEGNVIILGAAGKMGPSLAVRIGRAIQTAGLQHKVIAVVRKDRGDIFGKLSNRIEVVEADLLDRKDMDALPERRTWCLWSVENLDLPEICLSPGPPMPG